MPVQIACPKCRKPLSLGDDPAGRQVRCPACGAAFRVTPSADAASRRSKAEPAAPSSSAAAPPAARPQPGSLPATIGVYQVRKELGRGAFGIVYQGHDAKLRRDVAIKVLNADALASPRAVERFLREASVVAQMHHNHIVPVFQLDEQDGVPFIVSKFIAGQVLSEIVPEEGMDPDRAVELVIQLLEALQYAHDMGVLHRDVKPANAILDSGGRLYLMDFGLAGWVGQDAGRMTRDGAVMGTAAYMGPEQARGDLRQIGPAADQYSAGVVLYELLTGHLPFEGGPLPALMYNVVHTPPPPPSEWRADLDPGLEAICLKALAKDPKDRYPSCRDFATELRRWRGESVETVTVAAVAEDSPPARKREVKPETRSAAGKQTMTNLPPSRRTMAEPPPTQPAKPSARRGSWVRWLLALVGVIVAVLVLAVAVYVVVTVSSRPVPTNQRGPGLREGREKS
jgi:serine/threonine protein kinase